jgi:glucose/arabinose dehydrogenase
MIQGRWLILAFHLICLSGCASVPQATEAQAVSSATPVLESAATPSADPSSISLELIAEGFVSPIVLTHANDGSGRLFVADQIGSIYVITPDGNVLDTPFLDLRDRIVTLDEGYDERGLLGLAFHPEYADNGRFFVYYSAPLRDEGVPRWNHTSHISEFRVSAGDLNIADPASERIVLQIDQPQWNHNGGQIAFGPDGYLYIPVGDGGNVGDAGVGHPNGQNLETLLGKILRIDIDGGDPYAIPPDNPFTSGGGAPEIFAYGFRNPWRISFDSAGDGTLYVGDVGQNQWEEVDIVTVGGNYGWNVREGTHCFQLPGCPETAENGAPLIPPVIELDRITSAGVVGGNIYRGGAVPSLQGRYVFSSWSRTMGVPQGMIFAATPAGANSLWAFEALSISGSEDGSPGVYILSMGEDANRELYVLTTENLGPTGEAGKIWRIEPAP